MEGSCISIRLSYRLRSSLSVSESRRFSGQLAPNQIYTNINKVAPVSRFQTFYLCSPESQITAPESALQSLLKALLSQNTLTFFLFFFSRGEQISTHHGALAVALVLISLAPVSSLFLSLFLLTVFASSISGVEIPPPFHLFRCYLGIVIREHNVSFYFGSSAANAPPQRLKSSPLSPPTPTPAPPSQFLAGWDRVKCDIWTESCGKEQDSVIKSIGKHTVCKLHQCCNWVMASRQNSTLQKDQKTLFICCSR